MIDKARQVAHWLRHNPVEWFERYRLADAADTIETLITEITQLKESNTRLRLENSTHAEYMARELAKAKSVPVHNIDNPQRPEPDSGFALLTELM